MAYPERTWQHRQTNRTYHTYRATMSEESYEVTQHATIGPIKGLRKLPGVIQYLGIQYATLKDRFSRGELLLSYSLNHPNKEYGVLDATKLGYEASVSQPIIFSLKRRPTDFIDPGHFQSAQ